MSEIQQPNDITTDQKYIDLKKYLALKLQKPITPPKVLLLIASGVKFAEDFKNISGTEKKNIVIIVIKDVINSSDSISSEEKVELISYVDLFADVAIDTLVEFGRDAVTFIKSKCGSCWRC